MLIEHILNEKYINAIGFDDHAIALKKKYTQQVWDILQSSYKSIGGIKGKGFGSPEEMLKIPMWKIGMRDGQVKAVIMYKDKQGRKSVAVGTDGSKDGQWFINDIFKNELERSYGEKSKAALGKMMKIFPFDIIEPFLVSPQIVDALAPDDHIIPIKQIQKQKWPEDAVITLNKYPQLVDYGYLRQIGDNYIFKVMIGKPGIPLNRA